MYTVANVPLFHAGFGKSDLTRVFWESRATRVTAQFRIADTRKEERAYFNGKDSHAILGIYLPHFLPARLLSYNSLSNKTKKMYKLHTTLRVARNIKVSNILNI